MKYQDIQLGVPYYHDTSNKWEQYGSGEKITITDLTRYTRGSSWSGHTMKNVAGQYLYGRREGFEGTTLVRIAALRGLWDEIAPRQEAIRAEQLAAAQKEREERDALKKRIEAAVMNLGIKYDGYFVWYGRYGVSVEDLEDLVARLEPTV